MKIYNRLLEIIKFRGAAYLILLDPDKQDDERLHDFITHCSNSGVDGFLIGGNLLISGEFESFITKVKSLTSAPVIIFPGDINQISPAADAILFLSVVSGRNPEHLIGKHVLAAPIVKRTGIEPISTGYILVESGNTTTAQYMSGSLPVPRNKPEIASATALAAEYLGMKLVYLEAGSGAENSVPNEMVKAVASNCTVPVVVGGGIKSPSSAAEKVSNGAKVIVMGNFLEDKDNWHLIKDFADAIHSKSSILV